MYCTICGQNHETTACPPPQNPEPPQNRWQDPPALLNGVTPGEQMIIDRLDKLIELIG